MGNAQQHPPEKKRGRCCLWGCLSLVGMLALTGICLLTAPLILRAAGVIGQPAEVRYGAAPDQFASEQLQKTLDEFAIEGAKVYVIPEQGNSNQTAFIILDPSQGFDGFSDMEGQTSQADVNSRVDDILAALVDKNEEYNLRITRVAINYLDENGDTFATMTTSMAEVEDYLAGRLSYEEFYGEFGMGFGPVIRQLWEKYNDQN
jgi:hypothetical protein